MGVKRKKEIYDICVEYGMRVLFHFISYVRFALVLLKQSN